MCVKTKNVESLLQLSLGMFNTITMCLFNAFVQISALNNSLIARGTKKSKKKKPRLLI